MLFRLPLEVLIILIPVLIFSLCFHEFLHAYTAYRLGDDTAYRNGRLTLNPLAHLDPIGSLMILFAGFGWAKPVPVNPVNFSNPRLDMMKVAFAGPASNLLLAFAGGIVIRFINIYGIIISDKVELLLTYFMFVNIMLAVFNMIPIAPLDGSQIFGSIISKYNHELAYKLQYYGPKILLGLILFGIITKFSILGLIMSPFINFFMYLFAGI